MVTRSVEDYLKAIYKLQQNGSPATTNAIAESMGLRAASVTAMLQQLSKQGLAEYRRYKGAYLTDGGMATALRVIRRHRLIELYLNQHLGVPWDCVHDEAERLEHAITPYLEERIDAKLGYPSFDPHGAPIPSSTGALPVQDLVPLLDLPPDTPSVVRHIPDDDPELLRYVASLGLKPDVRITVKEHDPATGSVLLSVVSPSEGETTHEVSRAVGQHIFVRRPSIGNER
ncbi:MAG TPA: metal-dependent transcriptional regulator [Chloroflexia bacterium]|nr:metal-dependent transcriptional regulator [Chloroflexia bacterium]